MQNKLKICVYAICKNESKFVDRWINSMKEADEIVVVDTGSQDDTVEKLQKHGAKVYSKVFTPWRFDEARNYSLSKVPEDVDVCVCTDLDEVFEQNWREKIEKIWIKNFTTQLKYKYVWNVLENGEDGMAFTYEKIHARKGFEWIYPVHEILKCSLITNNIVYQPALVLRHFPDPTKSRAQYLQLLELSVQESPDSDRNTHYLAREYMFNGKYNLAIKYFKKHLKMKNSVWKEERSASYRYIADCYVNLGKNKMAEKNYKHSVSECLYTREPYLSLAKFYYENEDYLLCIFTLKNMLEIQNKTYSYITKPECWNEFPYDLLSMCYYFLKDYNNACKYCKVALEINSSDNRLKNNLKIFENLSK